jgi:anti-sigma factor RsiW
MNDCRAIGERLTAFVDELLPQVERRAIEQHLKVCAPCRRVEVLERGGRVLLQATANRLREQQPQAVLPPGLRSRCEALAADHVARAGARAPGASWRTRLVPLSLAVVLMIFSASAFLSLATHRSDGLMAAQFSRDHTRCFRRFAGSVGADAAQMEQMLNDLYGWRVHVPPSSPAAGVQLIGAKRCYYSGGAVPHILYRVNGAEMSLYVLDGVKRPPADLVAAGHRSQVWSRDDKTYVLVSPTTAGDMMTMAAGYVMQDAH